MTESIIKLRQELSIRRYKNIEKYCLCVSLFFVWYHAPISELNDGVLDGFFLNLKSKNITNKTIRLYKKALDLFCLYVLNVS